MPLTPISVGRYAIMSSSRFPFVTEFSYPLLYHVGRTKGNEPASGKDNHHHIIKRSDERKKKIGKKIHRIEHVEQGYNKQCLRAKRYSAVSKQSPIEFYKIRQMPDQAKHLPRGETRRRGSHIISSLLRFSGHVESYRQAHGQTIVIDAHTPFFSCAISRI